MWPLGVRYGQERLGQGQPLSARLPGAKGPQELRVPESPGENVPQSTWQSLADFGHDLPELFFCASFVNSFLTVFFFF